jgi:CheY-like chemotaxis protein
MTVIARPRRRMRDPIRASPTPVAAWRGEGTQCSWWSDQRAGPARPDESGQRAVKSVLVVDDDPDICQMLGHILATAGFEVSMELDGERGLSAARRMQPDLVLLDWMLPNLTGIEVCRRLREDPATAATRIIMVTARAELADLERSRAAGANDHLIKPFGRRELIRRIRTLLGD